MVRCHVGSTVHTPATGSLVHSYTHLLHTVPPFRASPSWEQDLTACYTTSLAKAMSLSLSVLAFPLLGAGARGASAQDAARVAVQAVSAFATQSAHHRPTGLLSKRRGLCVRFGFLDLGDCAVFLDEVEKNLLSCSSGVGGSRSRGHQNQTPTERESEQRQHPDPQGVWRRVEVEEIRDSDEDGSSGGSCAAIAH
uniref:Macro domain-containing protein n=1 Tax=Rhizochromulina marina TaxID=1034831 RepID=A0A7S2S3H2_9STRA